MTHPHITLTIEQARKVREALDVAQYQVETAEAVDLVMDSLKILSTELECLRYL